MINCLVVEDEPLARTRLVDYVEKISFLKLIASFDNGLDAINFLGSNKIDLIFLDVQMEGFTGIQLLESLKNRPEVILTTAHDQYALKGYDLNVSDFLLKPYTFERFMQAVLKVRDKLTTSPTTERPTFVFLKTEYRLEKIFLEQILYIEGMRDYRQVVCIDKNVVTPENFKDLEKTLPEKEFCRVHKSFMVSLSKIESIERDRIKIGNTLIPISETYKEQFYRSINK